MQKKSLKAVCTLQLIACIYYAYSLMRYGYLPIPFFNAKDDTLMDFYNPLYWAVGEGAYTVWRAVYPPLNFLILKIIDYFYLDSHCYYSNIFLRSCNQYLSITIVCIYFLIPFYILRRKEWREVSNGQFLLLYLLILTSTPLLFALERGNLILICLFLLPLLYDSRLNISAITIALLINIKPYFVILWIVYILKKRYIDLVYSLLVTAVIFMVTALLFDIGATLIFDNLFVFAQSQWAPLYHLLAFPVSLDIFIDAIKRQDFLLLLPLDLLSDHAINLTAQGLTVFKFSLFGAMFLVLYKKRNIISEELMFLISISFICNIGLGFGGYTLIFYLPFIPTIISLRYHKYIIFFILANSIPIELIYFVDYPGRIQKSFFSEVLTYVPWQFSFFSLLRPWLNLFVFCFLVLEVKNTRAGNTVKKSN